MRYVIAGIGLVVLSAHAFAAITAEELASQVARNARGMSGVECQFNMQVLRGGVEQFSASGRGTFVGNKLRIEYAYPADGTGGQYGYNGTVSTQLLREADGKVVGRRFAGVRPMGDAKYMWNPSALATRLFGERLDQYRFLDQGLTADFPAPLVGNANMYAIQITGQDGPLVHAVAVPADPDRFGGAELDFDADRGYQICRIAYRDPDGKVGRMVAINDWERVGGVWVPTSATVTYGDPDARTDASAVRLSFQGISLTNNVPDTTFAVDLSGAEIVFDELLDMTVSRAAWPGDDDMEAALADSLRDRPRLSAASTSAQPALDNTEVPVPTGTSPAESLAGSSRSVQSAPSAYEPSRHESDVAPGAGNITFAATITLIVLVVVGGCLIWLRRRRLAR